MAESELSVAGCFGIALRFAGCMASLYILMFVAIVLAGALLTIFF